MPREKNPQPWGLLKRMDEYSLVRSIVLGQARADYVFTKATLQGIEQLSRDEETKLKKDELLFKTLLNNRNDCQMILVYTLLICVNLEGVTSFSPEHVKTFQKHLNKAYGIGQYRLHLFEKKNDKWRNSWAGYHPSRKNILLIYENNRFDIVRSLRFFTKGYYCENCLKTSHKKDRHVCPHTCTNCSRPIFICIPDPNATSIRCADCGIYFLSRSCFISHNRIHNNGSRRCSTVCYCETCEKFYNTNMFPPGEHHRCFEGTYCYLCHAHREPGPLHKCYINIPTENTKNRLREKHSELAIICFDLETIQSIEKANGDGWDFLPYHIAASAVARKGCTKCFEKGINDSCERCGEEREKIFIYSTSESVISDFVDWLLQPCHNGYTLLAHYGGRFDNYILLGELARRKIMPDVICNGRRIITGVIKTDDCEIQIRDSYNLIPLPLSAFRKAFTLTCEGKGEYPYLFLEPKRFGKTYIGLPNRKYFNPGSKTVAQLAEFDAWYNSHDPNYEYNVDDELIRYNRMDTEILYRGLLVYRSTMIALTSWCPVSSAPTLAALTAHILRCNHLPRNTIVHLPELGYNFNRNQSDIAIRWLKYISHSKGIYIQHRENGGEKCFVIDGKKYFVDGWTPPKDDEDRGTIWEFLGCFFHGCFECHEATTLNKRLNTTFGALLAATKDRLKKLEQCANVISIWECSARKIIASEKTVKAFFDNCHNGRLILRESMMGGRCEAFARYAESSPTHKIVFYDVNSLYPHIMRSISLPVGSPSVVSGPFPATPSTHYPWRGIGCVTMLPPRGLRYPLLGIKMNDALLFINCRSCASEYHLRHHKSGKSVNCEDSDEDIEMTEGSQLDIDESMENSVCKHNDNERAITSSWTHIEILKAIELGYLVLAYHEIWHFSTFRDDLFKDYVRTFHRVKTTATGWPKGVESESDKNAFLDDYHRDMGGERIRFEEMNENASERAVAKLLLNTSWGRFAQRCMVRRTEIVDGDTLMDIMESSKKSISGHREIAHDVFLVSWSPIAEEIHSTPNANVAIASFITAGARLHLYRLLELSQGQALYSDTDSIFALIPREGNLLDNELGSQLGKLTNECEGKTITRALFGGPKQYAYQTVDDKTGEMNTVIKIRGITLDVDARKNFTFERMEEEIRKKKKKFTTIKGTENDMEVEEGHEVKEGLKTTRFNLKRKDLGIATIIESRQYYPLNKKGKLSIEDERILPFGYDRSDDS